MVCPDETLLLALLRDRLDGESQPAVETHVETCDACQDRLERQTRAESEDSVAMFRRSTSGTDLDVVERLSKASQILGPPAPIERPDVPGYQVMEELGRGGMAVVYKARHLNLDRVVALKMVTHAAAAGLNIRLRREAVTLAQLTHPGIVHVFDIGEWNGRPFFSLEYVAGRNLAQWLDSRPRPPRVAARIVKDVADAVEAAHRQNVLHRDLKPANILVMGDTDSEETPLVVKVTDFGLSKVLTDGGAGQSLSEAGAPLGTPSYMAPEQARGDEAAISWTADVYALGAVLYEILTGRPPFLSSAPLQTLLQVVHNDPVPVSRLQPLVPRDLATVCGKCLHKDHARRYPRVQDLADDLERFLNNEPVKARPVGPFGRLRQWSRRNPPLAATAAALVAVLALGFGLVLWQWQEASAARGRAEVLARAEAAARLQAERGAAELRLGQSLDLCEQGDVGAGMTAMADGLDRAVRFGFTDLERAFRWNLAAWSGRLLASSQSRPFGASVTAVAFSPDGRRLLVGRWANPYAVPGPGEARLYDPHTFRPVGPPLVHDGPVTAAAVSPDGRRLLTAGGDGTVQLWDAETGEPAGPAHRDLKAAYAVAFDRDGRRYAAGGADGRIIVYSAADGRTLFQATRADAVVRALAFHPTEDVFVAAGSETSATRAPAGFIGAWSGPDADWAHTLPAAVLAVAFRPNGVHVATGGEDQAVRLWIAADGKPVGRPLPNPHPIHSILFTADGKTIIAGSGTARPGGGEGAVYFWDAGSGKPLVNSFPHPDIVHGLALRSDGRVLATAGRDGRVRLWELGNARPVDEAVVPFPVREAIPTADGRLVILAGNDPAAGTGRVMAWSLADRKPVAPARAYDQPLTAVAVAPDGRRLAVALGQGLRLEALDSPTVPVNRAFAETAEHLAFSPDGGEVLATTKDGTAHVLDAATLQTVAEFPAPQRGRHQGRYSADGRFLFLGSPDGVVRVWDRAARTATATLAVSNKSVHAIDGSAEGFIAGAGDGRARAFHPATGLPLGPPLDHACEVIWAAHLADGLACTVGGSAYRDAGTVRFWNATTGLPIAPASPFRVAVRATAFDAARGLLATAGRDGDVRLWDARTGTPIGPLLRCANPPSCLALTPDGGTLVAGNDIDRVFRTWTVARPIDGSPADIMRWVRTLTEDPRLTGTR